MTRWIKQPDNYSCGPCAIINACKWLGIKSTLDDVQHFAFICNSTYDVGTLEPDFDRALRVIVGFYTKIRHEKSPRADRLFKHLNESEDNAAIVMCYYHNGDAHYYFITGVPGSKNVFRCVNRETKETVSYVKSKDVTTDLRTGANRKNMLKSHVWFLKKKDIDDDDE